MPKIGSIGIPELLIILVVVLLIFGPRRLPDMAKGLGQSVREFRKGLRDMRKEFDDEANDNGKPSDQAAAVSAASAATAAGASQAAAPVAQASEAADATAATTTPSEATPSDEASTSEDSTPKA